MSNELLLAHVDDICGKRSALVTKSNDGHHSLFSISNEFMLAKKVHERR